MNSGGEARVDTMTWAAFGRREISHFSRNLLKVAVRPAPTAKFRAKFHGKAWNPESVFLACFVAVFKDGGPQQVVGKMLLILLIMILCCFHFFL